MIGFKKETLEMIVLYLTIIHLSEKPMKKLYKLIKKGWHRLMKK